MTLVDLLLTILLTSLFCCGLTVASSDGMVLYFLRKPLDVLNKNNEDIKYRNRLVLDPTAKSSQIIAEAWHVSEYKILLYETILYLSKPIILCAACMGSFWGIIIFSILHGFHTPLIGYMVINCLAACFLNAFLITKYNRL